MGGYVIRRALTGVAMILALTLATFAVFSIIPFDPGRILLPNGTPTAAELHAADHQLGVDRPFYVQFATFLERVVLHGQFGHSFLGASINGILAAAGPVTLALVVGGVVVVLLLAVPLGILSARRPDSKIDRAVLALSIVGIALHPFVVGTLLRQWLGHDLGLLPNGGYCPFHALPPVTAQDQELGVPAPSCNGAPVLWMWFSHMLLPWLTFALFFLPFYVRLIRARLIETYSEPFVLTARAKGASETRIFARHALRFVGGSIVTIAAFDIGAGITGAMYVEYVFHLPGLGLQALQALGTSGEQGYDLPIMTGIVVTVAATVVVLNLAADVFASWLDPRIRLTRERR